MQINVACIIQARSKSTRLPYKWNLPFGDAKVIDAVVRAAINAKYVDLHIVAVPLLDNELISYCSKRNYNIFTGSENDVLDRYYQCAKIIKPKTIVRITADCPLLNSEIIDEAIWIHRLLDTPYSANRLAEPMYPDGFDVEVFSYDALEDAAFNPSLSTEDREHVTPFMKRHYPVHAILCRPELLPFKDTKLSLDTPEDYKRILEWKEQNAWK